ncbi:MAG: DUF4956 domain-containing protein [Bacteroidetes bacterium]|nr:MAG: DUF4956 domain-containing protein [Bacteroidota bacterium]
MSKFEEYLNQFSNTISFQDFMIGFLLTAILAILIRNFYVRFGMAISNRKRFANNFLALALIVMLIITIVKSSLALSLGLVGALSIVRFRAAIKDPEELVYLFLVIGLGLATGAGQFIIAASAIPMILLLLWFYYRFVGRKSSTKGNNTLIHLRIKEKSIQKVSEIFLKHLSHVELKRMDLLQDGIDITYICQAESVEHLDALKEELSGIDKDITFSIVDNPGLIA